MLERSFHRVVAVGAGHTGGFFLCVALEDECPSSSTGIAGIARRYAG
jgi:hypothetical protein